MENCFYDMSKLSIDSQTKDFFRKNNRAGVIITTSHFKDDKSLFRKIEECQQLNSVICLKIDSARRTIFDIEPNLAIYQLCEQYSKNSRRALEIIKDKSTKIAHQFLNHGIDLYLSPILSFADDIFNSAHANQSFTEHHIPVISAWINGLNQGGMYCCIEPAPEFIERQNRLPSLNRLRVQISAIVANKGLQKKIKDNTNYQGCFLEIQEFNPCSLSVCLNSPTSLKSILAGQIIPEATESVEF